MAKTEGGLSIRRPDNSKYTGEKIAAMESENQRKTPREDLAGLRKA
jgi:hypothetical protein